MSEGLNKCMFIGNLGADPDFKMTQGGQAVLKLRLACSEKYKDKNDQWVERTEWVSASMWGRRAESLSKFLAKGARVFIEGSLRTSSYEKNGEKRYSTEINVSNLILCGGKSEGTSSGGGGGGGSRGGGGGGGGGRAPAPAPADDYNYGGGGGGGDDDIPFVVDATRFGRRDRP